MSSLISTLTVNMSQQQLALFKETYARDRRSVTVALILAIIPITGGLGIQRFYLGQTGPGIAHLLLWLLAILPGLLFWIVDIFLMPAATAAANDAVAQRLAVQAKALAP